MTSHLCILTLALAPVVWAQTQPTTAPASQAAQALKFQVASAADGGHWKGERSPQEIIRPTWAAEVTFRGRRDSLYDSSSAERAGF